MIPHKTHIIQCLNVHYLYYPVHYQDLEYYARNSEKQGIWSCILSVA